MRSYVLSLDEPRHPVHQNAGFTASRTRDDEVMAKRCGDRLALAFVQAF